MEIAALIASAVSIALGGYAIWLSITFFKMSTRTNENTIEAAKEISSGVLRLDELFNKLYADTFGIMKDTMTDMRKHMWPEIFKESGQDQTKATNVIKELTDQMKTEISIFLKKILEEQKIPKDKSEALEKGLSDKLGQTLRDSEIRVRKILSERIANIILANIGSKGIIAQNLFSMLTAKQGIAARDFFATIYSLKKQGQIAWKGTRLEPSSEIFLCSQGPAN